MTIDQAGERTFSITEIRREFGVSARALRYYEERMLLSPLRSGAYRRYSEHDRARLAMIIRGRKVGLSLVDIIEIVNGHPAGSNEQARAALERFRAQIVRLQRRRVEIVDAITALQAACLRLEGDAAAAPPPDLHPVAVRHDLIRMFGHDMATA